MDIVRLSRQLGFDLAATRSLVCAFAQTTEGDLVGLESAVAAGDAVGAGRAAHHIKGAAANLDLAEVVEAARSIEAAASAGSLAGVDAHVACIRTALAALRAGLA